MGDMSPVSGIPGMADAGGAAGDTPGPAQIPLGMVAHIRTVSGPMAVKTEQAFPTAWVFIDVEGSDLGSYVRSAQKMVDAMVKLPAGYTMSWSGQYEYMQRAKAKLEVVVPATLVIIFLLLYLNFGRVGETLVVMLSLPFSLVGGVLIMALLGFNWSVATGVGFIALAGVASEIGVIMLLYLGNAWEEHRRLDPSPESLRRAVIQGAALRVRPIVMTVTAVIGGLLPIFWGHGTGASVMRRIAAPMVGGMVSATVLTLLVIPAIYSVWQEAALRGQAREASRDLEDAVTNPAGAD
jgi:Cu(I)/Ag(I) efflux system membrane protein CusA/SilA